MSEIAGSGGVGLLASASAGEPSFTWSHTHKLDAQFRAQCPADWRPADPNFEFMLIIWPHHPTSRDEAYIKGLTQRKYNELSQKFNGMSMGEAKTDALR